MTNKKDSEEESNIITLLKAINKDKLKKQINEFYNSNNYPFNNSKREYLLISNNIINRLYEKNNLSKPFLKISNILSQKTTGSCILKFLVIVEAYFYFVYFKNDFKFETISNEYDQLNLFKGIILSDYIRHFRNSIAHGSFELS